ncbi:MAG: RDD family protein [Candidatus Kapaibacterium sp.]|nr:RDD family protein [Bacteroidota bacterium]
MNTMHVSIGLRIGTMVLDHFIMTFITVIFAIPFVAELSMNLLANKENSTPTIGFEIGIGMYIACLGYALYFCKDAINGRSPAKRILKLQVVNAGNGEVATPIRCLVRNLTCIIWPIEVIVALIRPERRLGDLIAGTRIENFDPDKHVTKVSIPQVLISIIISYALVVVGMHLYAQLYNSLLGL